MAAGKRDLKKESFWRRVVRKQMGSGMSVRAWCGKHRIKDVAFYWWRKELARRDSERESAGFVPVHITEDPTGDAASRIEIMLAGGRRVRIHGHVDRQMLADVLDVVTSASSVEPERPSC